VKFALNRIKYYEMILSSVLLLEQCVLFVVNGNIIVTSVEVLFCFCAAIVDFMSAVFQVCNSSRLFLLEVI
jgi:hypothetical protein